MHVMHLLAAEVMVVLSLSETALDRASDLPWVHTLMTLIRAQHMTPCWREVVVLLRTPTSSLSRRLGLAKVPQDVPAPGSRTKEELVFLLPPEKSGWPRRPLHGTMWVLWCM